MTGPQRQETRTAVVDSSVSTGDMKLVGAFSLSCIYSPRFSDSHFLISHQNELQVTPSHLSLHLRAKTRLPPIRTATVGLEYCLQTWWGALLFVLPVPIHWHSDWISMSHSCLISRLVPHCKESPREGHTYPCWFVTAETAKHCLTLNMGLGLVAGDPPIWFVTLTHERTGMLHHICHKYWRSYVTILLNIVVIAAQS